jgi:hypothetical protein
MFINQKNIVKTNLQKVADELVSKLGIFKKRTRYRYFPDAPMFFQLPLSA